MRKIRCRNGLQREDVFLLLMVLADASDARDGPPPLDLSMLIEPHPLRSVARRPQPLRSVAKDAQPAAPAGA